MGTEGLHPPSLPHRLGDTTLGKAEKVVILVEHLRQPH